MIGVNVPSYRFPGEDAVLKCLYDLEDEHLYRVKWYKDGQEFFRFIPGDPDPIIATFNQPGVSVDVRYSPLKRICLKCLDSNSTTLILISNTIK